MFILFVSIILYAMNHFLQYYSTLKTLFPFYNSNLIYDIRNDAWQKA
jgi:hypothetical protein